MNYQHAFAKHKPRHALLTDNTDWYADIHATADGPQVSIVQELQIQNVVCAIAKNQRIEVQLVFSSIRSWMVGSCQSCIRAASPYVQTEMFV